jgi:hypothetical protein
MSWDHGICSGCWSLNWAQCEERILNDFMVKTQLVRAVMDEVVMHVQLWTRVGRIAPMVSSQHGDFEPASCHAPVVQPPQGSSKRSHFRTHDRAESHHSRQDYFRPPKRNPCNNRPSLLQLETAEHPTSAPSLASAPWPTHIAGDWAGQGE